MKMKFIRVVSSILSLILTGTLLSSCNIKIWKSFDDWVKTTEDDFACYNERTSNGVYIKRY